MWRYAPLLFLLTGCLVPRSAVFGQTAAPLGPGAKEAALSMGFSYQSQSAPPVGPSQQVSRALTIPAFEANLGVGLTEMIDLNVHASPAGVQPGAKFALVRKRGKLAILPQLGLGFGSNASSVLVTDTAGRLNETVPTQTTTFMYSLGVRAIASHVIGLYGGVGYDLQSITTSTASTAANGTQSDSSTGQIQHSVGVAFGWEIKLDRAVMRPELAAVFTPASFSSTSSGGNVISEGGGGFAWMVMPTFTIAVGSEPDKTDRAEEEDEKQLGSGGEEREEDDEAPRRRPESEGEDD